MSFVTSRSRIYSKICVILLMIIIITQIYFVVHVCDYEIMVQKISYDSRKNILSKEHLDIIIKTNTIKYNKLILDYTSMITSLPQWDFKQLSNLTNFKFLILNKVCDNDNVILLTIVASAPNHFTQRNVIRNTWGNKNITNMRVLFSLGATEIEQQVKIEEENMVHHDILQGNFIDTYKNLTYKQIMNLKYVVYYCPQARYIMKMDDDFFVHTPNLIKYLQNGPPNPTKNVIFCVFNNNATVLRNNTKWPVSFEEFPDSIYPRYCLGNYPTIYRYNVVYNLYKECQRGDFFYIEDVYITGIIAKRLNITHKQARGFSLWFDEMTALINNWLVVREDFLYSWQSLNNEQITKLWDIVKNNNNDFTYSIDF